MQTRTQKIIAAVSKRTSRPRHEIRFYVNNAIRVEGIDTIAKTPIDQLIKNIPISGGTT